eukprot:5528233-Amphidinium_carterae.1
MAMKQQRVLNHMISVIDAHPIKASFVLSNPNPSLALERQLHFYLKCNYRLIHAITLQQLLYECTATKFCVGHVNVRWIHLMRGPEFNDAP